MNSSSRATRGTLHTLPRMATDTQKALAAQLAEDAAARLVRYVRVDTQSEEDSESYPSTAKQLDLLRLLADELRELGLDDVALDDNGYVTATLRSTVAHDTETVAFFAHVDTAREVTGANVNPQRFRYEGGDVPLGSSGSTIKPSESPQLAHHEGHDLITTDGTTLLGADDKAGIAEIMAAVAYMKANPDVPHGTVKVAFNPDEEIGRGVIPLPDRTLSARSPPTRSTDRRRARCRARRSPARRCACRSRDARSIRAGRRARC